MDDDDLRRGQPTCHRAFDEATAILAGDALQALAFEVLAGDPILAAAPERQVRVIGAIAAACGAAGMAGGQALDLASLNRDISYPELERMHRLKTGALIRVSAFAPAIVAGADSTLLAKLDRYGDRVGLAFQVHDDILDVTASSQQTGKPAQADAARNKPTFPSVLGIDESRQVAARLCAEAEAELEGFPNNVETLAWLARYAIERSN
jgi:geranylgeranyl pyrophosphate synthase